MINWFNEKKNIPSLHFLAQDIVEERKMKEGSITRGVVRNEQENIKVSNK